MNKYRAAKDKVTGQWLVERIEQWFDIPIVVATCNSRAVAYEGVRGIRDYGEVSSINQVKPVEYSCAGSWKWSELSGAQGF